MNISDLCNAPVGLWLILTIAFVVGEFATVGLTSIWFGAGALCAMLVAMAGGGFVAQIVVFLVVSFLLLFATRPWAKKYINSRVVKTNADEHIGKEIVIAERVSNAEQTGMAVVNGQEWTVRSVDEHTIIEAGKKAIVREIRGVKLIVEEEKEN